MISQRVYKLLGLVCWLNQISFASPYFLNKSTLQVQIHSSSLVQWKTKKYFNLHLVYFLCLFEMLRRMHSNNKVNEFHLTLAFFLSVILLTTIVSIVRFHLIDAARGTNAMFQFLHHLHGKIFISNDSVKCNMYYNFN